ncbi:hypothetical protein BpHYR1_032672 [Brachionus plicatilis]|uniref:Uncharacterized protein n=1 Tax=Brachionus plicatilis TaxID=10195 RepID=A0A3M7PSH6_BRAPC|nr:hypothetical protein BpHYR1_032672 [Brachionus plicatilis]
MLWIWSGLAAASSRSFFSAYISSVIVIGSFCFSFEVFEENNKNCVPGNETDSEAICMITKPNFMYNST